MTAAAWLLEYHALRRKEREEQERQVEMTQLVYTRSRDTLIALFGLNLLGEKTAQERAKDTTEGRDPDMPKFVPLSFLTGQPEVMQHYLAQGKRHKAEEAAVSDESFDMISDAILRQAKGEKSGLPSRMAELLTGDLTDVTHNAYWKSEEAQQQLASLVKPRSSDRMTAHVSGRPQVENFAVDPSLLEADAAHRAPAPSAAELERFRKALGGSD